MSLDPNRLVELPLTDPLWDRFFWVAPLVVVGTREPTGDYDFAPKHLAMPLSWETHFGFVCTPRHATYHNAIREGAFTVTFVRPDQVVVASLTASPRCEDTSQPVLSALPSFEASRVDGLFLEGGHVFLECEMDRVVDGFGENSLVCGRIVRAVVDEQALRVTDGDDEAILDRAPVMAYLDPDRYTPVTRSLSFPFPAGFNR